MSTRRDRIFLFLKGVGMGCADIIPGVSGGTIAFITGIYEELINSIKAVDLEALKLLLSGKFSAFWSKINGGFLIVLLLGILTSILSLARIITNLLANHPIQLWSFFFGLIAISALVVSRDIHRWNITVVLGLLVGGLAAYLITQAVPAQTPNSLPLIFLSGAVAICAMILPGISGSFILLILGKYTFILTAIKDFQLGTLLVFSLGCLLGLMTFSRLISWLFKKYRNLTIAVLAGFMIGSLNKVWPWKKTVETYMDRHGEVKPLVQENILPTTFQSMGQEPYFWQALLFCALGIGLVVLLEKIAANLKNA